MPKAIACVETKSAEKYGRRLCKHFAHKIEAEWNSHQGYADFSEERTCHMTLTGEALILDISPGDGERLEEVKEIVGGHLERFGERESLMAEWTPKGAT